MWSLFMVSLVAFGLSTRAFAIPTKITYQGTLKEKSLPVNATKNMRFRITNQQGTQVYWSSNDIAVKVTNGLFSQELDPTGVNWQAITPYIEVAIEGQTLTPREPLNGGIYAALSGDIVDGIVSPVKVTPGYGLVPSGAIVLFEGACPSGWSRFSNLDDKFPLGMNISGQTGGSSNHLHSISTDGQHAHTVSGVATIAGNSLSAKWQLNSSPSGWEPRTPDQTASISGSHSHGGATGSASSLPPFYSVLYCKKN